jgi:hypothetical protein
MVGNKEVENVHGSGRRKGMPHVVCFGWSGMRNVVDNGDEGSDALSGKQ